jgi:hypothetical protein
LAVKIATITSLGELDLFSDQHFVLENIHGLRNASYMAILLGRRLGGLERWPTADPESLGVVDVLACKYTATFVMRIDESAYGE